MDLKDLKNRAEKEISLAQNLEALNEISKKYLGKKGEITLVLRSLKDLPITERKKQGQLANQIKKQLEQAINNKDFKTKEDVKDRIDITAPGTRPLQGHLHPITLVKKEVEDIFAKLGFETIEGPEVEDEWHNFDALNIPKEHPARDMWDTFWLKEKGLLLRTHTSPVQVRYMEKNNPPLRIIVPGRCFRYEATDASHEINFYHIEGLMIDKEISASNFKAIMEKFFQEFFKKQIKLRIRPSYFPFTEPSFELDLECLVCGGKGCSVCSKRGRIEMAGAGMVHPNVLKAVNLNPNNWQGFAFGMGLDRLTMMKYKIDDIRLLYSSDLRFLRQF
ncbi:phenylalanine--tRNA ligase subunit alpha [Patescibacteria group bacterium]|nr:phenylalanine--tRNA ligase subunit alpha [Patescibacteria group bacterium]